MPNYFITISPPRRALAPSILYQQDIYVIRQYLNRCSDHYILYPEFSNKSRLHYHGIVRITDIIKWHKQKHQFDKVLGYTQIDLLKTHKDHLRSLVYSMKEWPATSALLKEPIIYKSNKVIKREKVLNELDYKFNDYEDNKSKQHTIFYYINQK